MAYVAPISRKWFTSPSARAAYTYIPDSVPIPPLYSQDGKGDDAIAYIKLFDPRTAWTWYLTEYDPETKTAFGMTVDFEDGELGYVSLDELSSIAVGMRLPIERDIHWTPRTLRSIRAAKGVV